jgi:hypothetical protein
MKLKRRKKIKSKHLRKNEKYSKLSFDEYLKSNSEDFENFIRDITKKLEVSDTIPVSQ